MIVDLAIHLAVAVVAVEAAAADHPLAAAATVVDPEAVVEETRGGGVIAPVAPLPQGLALVLGVKIRVGGAKSSRNAQGRILLNQIVRSSRHLLGLVDRLNVLMVKM